MTGPHRPVRPYRTRWRGDREGEAVDSTELPRLFRRWCKALRLSQLAEARAETQMAKSLLEDPDASNSDRARARAQLSAAHELETAKIAQVIAEQCRMRLLLWGRSEEPWED